MSYARLSYSADLLHPLRLSSDGTRSLLDFAGRGPRAVKPRQRMSAARADALIAATREHGHLPVALRAGATATGSDVELFRNVVRSALTPRQAVLAAARYLPLLVEGRSLTLSEEHGTATVRIAPLAHVPVGSDDLILGALLELASMVRARVRLRLGRAWDPSHYTIRPTVKAVDFGAAENGFTFGVSGLDREWASSCPRLHALLCSLAESALVAISDSWVLQVRECVRELLPLRVQLPAIAKELGLRPRKLSRLMAREGTSYASILEDVRRSRALELVTAADFTLTEAARLAGFTDRASFHRAFRRWTNQTPMAYRRQTRSGSGDSASPRLVLG